MNRDFIGQDLEALALKVLLHLGKVSGPEKDFERGFLNFLLRWGSVAADSFDSLRVKERDTICPLFIFEANIAFFCEQDAWVINLYSN